MATATGIRGRVNSAIASVLFWDSVQPDGSVVQPGPVRSLVVRMNQALTEQGVAPPWVNSRDAIHGFWSNDVNVEPEAGNKPADYSAKPSGAPAFMDAFWKPFVSTDDEILELGCNAGPNLRGLYDLGYRRLVGMDINPVALGMLRERSPDLAEAARLEQGSFEELLAKEPDDAVDVIFSTTVLHHVHPSSVDLFREIARVARRYIFVLEHETALNSYHFPRNYRRIFERYGARQVGSALITPEVFPDVNAHYAGCTARLLRLPGA
jgi:SAM-dependent methyltransferase